MDNKTIEGELQEIFEQTKKALSECADDKDGLIRKMTILRTAMIESGLAIFGYWGYCLFSPWLRRMFGLSNKLLYDFYQHKKKVAREFKASNDIELAIDRRYGELFNASEGEIKEAMARNIGSIAALNIKDSIDSIVVSEYKWAKSNDVDDERVWINPLMGKLEAMYSELIDSALKV